MSSSVRFKKGWPLRSLAELEALGHIRLGRGNVISQNDIQDDPGNYPVYSSSVRHNGVFGSYGKYMFDEELITWSIDGGGNFFYRPRHKFSVTNVTGYIRVDTWNLHYRFLFYVLDLQHRYLEFDYVGKAHPSVIRSLYQVPMIDATQQTAIAGILVTVDQAIAQTEALIAKQRRIKAGLLHDLLTRGIDEHGNLRDPATHRFKASPVGLVPEEWEIKKLTEVCEAIVDCPHSTPNYSDEGIPCIRTADLEPGHILLEQAYRVSEEDCWTRTRRLIPRKGDIIYSREGERLGIAGLVKDERVCLGQRVMHIRPDSQTDSDFLLWVLNSAAVLNQVYLSVSSTTSPHVNVEDISRFFVQVPPAPEQTRIGKFLTKQSQLIEIERTNIAKLQSLKTGLMQDLLTGRVSVAGLVKQS